MTKLSEEHADYLRRQAIGEQYLAIAETVPEGLAFHFTGVSGRTATQIRLDNPEDPDTRYIGPKGEPSVMPVPLGYEELLVDLNVPLVIVEGSKGHLAVATAMADTADAKVAVVGVLGCWGWSSEKRPTEDVAALRVRDREVFILLDADVTQNRQVWEAAKELAEYLTVVKGAGSVKFGKVPGRAKESMDDVLASQPPEDREAIVRRVLASAKDSLGRPPAAKPRDHDSPFGDQGYSAVAAAEIIEATVPLAAGIDHCVTVYRDGQYHNGRSRMFNQLVQQLLGPEFSTFELRNVESATLTNLVVTGKVIPEQQERLLIPFRNGLLDPMTMTLHPHDPAFRTMRQFQVDWDPDAKAPFYEEWLAGQVNPAVIDDLEEVVSQMFDMTTTPLKGALLFGPSRSGKGTFSRLVEKVAGKENVSAVSIHQLSDNRFAAADLYGMTANIHADLSNKEVADLSLLKLAMGEDYIRAERKNGQPFTFRNTALMVFSANEIPAVSESSQAYFNRIKPFAFPNTYQGSVDVTVTPRLLAELPGIVVRWVKALVRRLERGGEFLDTDPETDERFRTYSDQVVRFIRERYELGGEITYADLFADYRVWVQEEDGRGLGRKNFLDRVRNVPVQEVRVGPSRARGFALTRKKRAVPRGSGRNGLFQPIPTYMNDSSPTESVIPRQGKGETARTARNSPDPVAVDTETASADHLFDGRPDFLRLTCTPDGPVDPATLAGRTLIAHNGFGFDFHALGVDVVAEGDAGHLIDTQVLGILDHPPLGRRSGREVLRDYSLNAMADRYGIPGKSHDIKALAKAHGGFDKIPVDDPDYVAYCQQDAAIAAQLVEQIGLSDYARREMRVMARLAGPITGTGFAVDRALLDQRLAERESRLAERKAWLAERFGMPTDSAAPHRTKPGMEALTAAFTELGADPSRWPSKMRTPKGAPSFGGDSMDYLIGHATAQGGHDDVIELAEVVKGLNKERTVYGTALDNLRGDGRVHPSVFPAQASGRFSTWDPGLTVFGKRAGKFVERDIFVADPGCLLVAFDLNQIDARAVAVHSQDPEYLKLFLPGVDSHTEVAMSLWGDPSRREQAKAIAHGWNYGEGIPALVRNTGLPEETIRSFDAGMRQRFPRLVEWRREVYEMGRAGAMLDNGFGRQLKVDPKFAYTQAPAYMGQSTARDLMVEGVLRLPLHIVRMIRAFVHDEIVLSIPESSVEGVAHEVLEALTFRWAPPGADLDVEITAGASKASRSWGGCYVKGA